ncbi:GNAT family N-acetyltransferase [Phycicoccus sp. MAQZ13P-2]|uniref:GNAT family N-acetyltransferase n=1 Tax=Phycicoccus mangrovi TaxID=2840470 RepID=UPI001C003BD0|nr:GNAT family N-acetyltransferase [Phycicoccus mangrovi]MBT9257112.1 GNAT family N-acetyltransferase [Phycicoccus mangrovi]MBT9275398.1 GNAT family N-acetyltransferase [Phycicoccus mangrovi]
MTGATPLTSYDELLEASGHHPVVELDVGRGAPARSWVVRGPKGGTAVAFARNSDHGVPGASVLGPADALAVLVADPAVQHWFHDGGFRHLSRPVDLDDLVEAHLPVGSVGGDWEWMWTRTAPAPVAGEERVVPLTEAARDEIVALLIEASPRTHGQPFARPDQVWLGVRDTDGSLLACGGSEPSTGGTPTLAGIAVVPAARRQGLGAAVTAALTRDAVARTGACALGMFSDNQDARRMYHRLGFTTGMAWRSRWREGSLPRLARD